MIKTFPIDFVRSAIDFALFKNRNNTNYFNDNDISLVSFYEHISDEDEVQRYVEHYKQLIGQQNKEDIIGVGTITTSDNPTFINNKQFFICPFEWTATIRCKLENRDKMLGTFYKVLESMRGRKIDVACLDNGKLQAVGSVGNENDMYIHDFDFLGTLQENSDSAFESLLQSVCSYGFGGSNFEYCFCEYNNKLVLCKYDDGEFDFVDGVVPTHDSFEKYKVSLSFTDIKATQPYSLNGDEYVEIIFGGSATLTTHNVKLGNDLVKVRIAKNHIKGTTDYSFKVSNQLVFTTLEPQENNSGLSSNTIANKLRSNFLLENSHTDTISITHEYTFILDTNKTLLVSWYEYSTYGDQKRGTNGTITNNSITPNIVYTINEIHNSWGNIKSYTFNAKIVENIDINGTESDVITLTIPFQLQGENE